MLPAPFWPSRSILLLWNVAPSQRTRICVCSRGTGAGAPSTAPSPAAAGAGSSCTSTTVSPTVSPFRWASRRTPVTFVQTQSIEGDDAGNDRAMSDDDSMVTVPHVSPQCSLVAKHFRISTLDMHDGYSTTQSLHDSRNACASRLKNWNDERWHCSRWTREFVAAFSTNASASFTYSRALGRTLSMDMSPLATVSTAASSPSGSSSASSLSWPSAAGRPDGFAGNRLRDTAGSLTTSVPWTTWNRSRSIS